MKFKFLFLSLIVTVILFSCRKELDKPSWDTHDIAPIVSASLSINNLLPDSILQTNPDSSLTIVFKSDLFNYSMDTLFKIPDTTLAEVYTLPATLTLQAGQEVVTNNLSETTYSLKGSQLKMIVIKSGAINYNIISYIKEVTDFRYSFASASKNGVPFAIDVEVPAAVGNTPGVYNETFDLSGYTISLTGINNDKTNTIFTSLTASVSQDGQAVNVGPSDSLIIKNTFQNFIPYFAKGYFGKNTIDIGPDETEFSVFKNITDGTIQLEDVNFELSIENPIGMDAQIYINELSSINTHTGTTINLVNANVGVPINVNRAAEGINGNIFETHKDVVLNTSNSNIKDMLENIPDKFGYSLQLITNPLGNIAGSNDFIYSDSLLKVFLNMDIPLSMVATNLTLMDTIDLNLSGNNDDEQAIKSGTLTALVDNGFPFDAELQIYLLNADNVIIDSLIATSNTIDAADVDGSFKASDKKHSEIIIPLSEVKMDVLYATKKAILNVIFNTSSQPQMMKIYSDYEIDLQLIADVNFTIQLN